MKELKAAPLALKRQLEPSSLEKITHRLTGSVEATMQPTEKLYFTDSDLLEFPATVVNVQTAEQAHHVILDRTAFYPTGGGQPNDTGLLGESRVVDVFEDDAGAIHHV